MILNEAICGRFDERSEPDGLYERGEHDGAYMEPVEHDEVEVVLGLRLEVVAPRDGVPQ